MTTVAIPAFCRAPLVVNRAFRNSTVVTPDAGNTTFMQEEVNRLLFMRCKQWNFFCPIAAIPAAGGAGNRTRWRWYFHSSSHASYLYVRMVLASSRNATNPRAVCLVTNAGTLATASATHYFGNQSATVSDTPAFFGIGNNRTAANGLLQTISPDTDYYGEFTDYDNARLVSASVWEIPLAATTGNGYIQSGVVAGGNIYDSHRQDMVTRLRTAWKRNAAPLITWSVNRDADAVTTAGPTKNVIDTSISTVSAASPGFTVDLRYRSTVRRSSLGVPCIMRAYLDGSSATTVSNLLLKDSSGTTLATATLNGTSEGWVSSGAFYLPATLQKLDLMISQSNIGTASAFAASVYQYET